MRCQKDKMLPEQVHSQGFFQIPEICQDIMHGGLTWTLIVLYVYNPKRVQKLIFKD
jgi:hypothetical protein